MSAGKLRKNVLWIPKIDCNHKSCRLSCVEMMQSADFRKRNDPALLWRNIELRCNTLNCWRNATFSNARFCLPRNQHPTNFAINFTQIPMSAKHLN